MDIHLIYCKNCGIQYSFLAGGFYQYEEEEKFGTQEYCFDCSKIVAHFEELKTTALNKIEKKSAISFIPTNEVTLEQLLEWERLTEIENASKPFPVFKQVFALMCNGETGEWEAKNLVTGRNGFKNRIYFYCYWPSKKHEAKITVKARVDSKTDEILQYQFK